LFYGKECEVYIEDSKFQDIIRSKPIPAISNLKYSNVTVTNTEFSNLK